MKIKTSELTGAALDWAVAKCLGFDSLNNYEVDLFDHEDGSYSQLFHCFADDAEHAKEQAEDAYPTFDVQSVEELPIFNPTTDWSLGGPIIEREHISVTSQTNGHSWAAKQAHNYSYGTTPLIAAMRCFVASQLGDEVEIPDELTRR